MAKVDLFSPLTPEECVDRLRAMLTNPSGEVEGRVEGDRGRIRKRVFGRTWYRTFLRVRLLPHGTGTRLCGSFGPHPLLNAFVGVWFVFLFLGFLIAVVTGNYQSGLWVLPVLVFVAVGIVWFRRLLSRDKERRLVEIVTLAVKAEPVVLK